MPNFVYENNFSQLLALFLPTIYGHNETFQVDNRYIYNVYCNAFDALREDIKSRLPGQNMRIHIYASKAPTFYFAWISVPNNALPLNLNTKDFTAPKRTFGFVALYGHNSPSLDNRPAIYFDNSQTTGEMPLLNYYTASTVRFFEQGLKPPLIPETGPANPPYLSELVTDKDWADSRSKCHYPK